MSELAQTEGTQAVDIGLSTGISRLTPEKI